MTYVRPPEVVDAVTVSDLPGSIEGPHITVDLVSCRLFGADGYTWLSQLLTAGHRVHVTGERASFRDLVARLVPAHLSADGRLSIG